jgi:hypothetical protein
MAKKIKKTTINGRSREKIRRMCIRLDKVSAALLVLSGISLALIWNQPYDLATTEPSGFPALFLLAGMGGFLMNSFKCRTQRVFCILTIAGIFLTVELYPHVRHCFAAGKILRTARREPLRFLGFAQRDND